MSSAQIDVARRNWTHVIITEKNTTREHVSKRHMNTQQGKTHPKGMKTHQKGNTIERILSFIFIGFLTCGDFAQRGESTCHLHK